MKALLFLLCAVFFSGNALASEWRYDERPKGPNHPTEYRNSNPSRLDVLIENNRHVVTYAPKDLDSKHVTYRNGRCTEDGYYGTDRSVTKKCQDFHSASQGNWWRVRFGKAGNAEYVFRLKNGDPELWVKFRPGTQTVEYASLGAQQYASAHGNQQVVSGNAEQNVPPVSQSACDHLTGKARAGCEAAAISPALGGLLKW